MRGNDVHEFIQGIIIILKIQRKRRKINVSVTTYLWTESRNTPGSRIAPTGVTPVLQRVIQLRFSSLSLGLSEFTQIFSAILTSSSQLPLSSPGCLFKRGSLVRELAPAFPSPLRVVPRVSALRAARELFRADELSDISEGPRAPIPKPSLKLI